VSPITVPARKRRPAACYELASELVFRPLAQLVVAVLAPLRVPPPAVVLAGTGVGAVAAVAIGRDELLLAALLLQLKTVLDGADGQLARATNRVTPLGRYLDSESDLLVNAALFAAIGYRVDRPWLALAAFLTVTVVLSLDYNLERLYRREQGVEGDPTPRATGLAGALGRVYDVVYAPQDRAIEWFVERRLRRIGGGAPAARRAYHDTLTLRVLANFGLSTQFAALGVCLAIGRPTLYLWLCLGCGAAAAALLARRELLARRAVRKTAAPQLVTGIDEGSNEREAVWTRS
jgi:phosphatidylglycerophosphate synthase